MTCSQHVEFKEDFSLLEDHYCNKEEPPQVCVFVGREHKDEIWAAKFSPDGSKFVSVCQNLDMVIWALNLDTLQMSVQKKQPTIHAKDVLNLEWSPDSKIILSCSADKSIKQWDAASGNMIL